VSLRFSRFLSHLVLILFGGEDYGGKEVTSTEKLARKPIGLKEHLKANENSWKTFFN
jgi:hypothetical protein